MISEIPNVIAFSISMSSLAFTVWYWRVFRWAIAIPLSMALASGLYQWTDMRTLTSIMYDISCIVALGLLIGTRVCRSRNEACSTCSHNARCK